MADEQIVTNIVANSDFSNLITDLNKVSSALTKLQDKLQATNKTLAAQAAVMNRNFADTMRSTGQFSTHFVSLTSDVDKFGSQLDKGQMKLKQFFNVYGQHAKTSGGLIRDLAKQQVQLQNAILQPLGRNAEGLMQYNVHIPRGLDIVKNKAAIARQELQIMNKVIQEGAGQLINWGKNTQWAGRQLTVGLTVPMAAFGKASADAFKSADEQLVRLTKVYGGLSQTSSNELLKVRSDVVATAREISKSMGASFNETIGLAADIAATGKTGNDLLKSVQETTRLAVLGEVDRQEAMKATLAIQTAFKSNTEELSQSINFLNAVENQTSTTLADLVEAIPKAGPIVKGLGGDVKDLALYLTAMREGGINASEGANALKSGLASLINPTKVATGMFADFGIDLKGIVQKNAGDTTATILNLQSALEKLNPLQKQQALEQLFGKFQFARMNALFENLGKQGSQTLQVMDLMKASSEDLANLAGRELSQVTESASGKYRRAVEGLKADLAAVGEQFLTINTNLINFIDGILKFVNKLPDPLKKVLGVLGLFTAAAGPIIMLTGVLGNFFGYIIKGVSHMRALFKGGEGWKLLTPEILAANKAGDLIEQTFYNDASAASVLRQAIKGLSLEFDVLNQKATLASEAVSINPLLSTVGGNVVASPRSVNPNSPFVGDVDTRAAGHHNPVSKMTEQQRIAQTLHSFTPAAIPVNQRIGATPQIFAHGDLPDVPGLTSVNTKVNGKSMPVSTGIVAGEAAKWHALMATLSMQTKTEVAQLKKEIATTGSVSSEFMATYSQILPSMTQITDKAAAQSMAIVQEMKAGKITLDQARARIMAANTELESMMIATTTKVAGDLGRTANLTTVPLIDQPVVDASGKANIKELFRKGRPQKTIIDRIARVLGVRTYGAGYSTATTFPKKLAAGGIVPGTGNTDSYATSLAPGSFVVNKQATADNMDILGPMLGMNAGGEVPVILTPGEAVIDPATAQSNLGLLNLINGPGSKGPGYNQGGFLPATMLWQGSAMNAILAHPDQEGRRKSLGLGPGDTIPGQMFADDFAQMRKKGMHPGGMLYDIGARLGYNAKDLQFAINPMEKEIRTTLASSGNITATQYDQIVSKIMHKHLAKVKRMSPARGRQVSFLEEIASLGFARNARNKGIAAGSLNNVGFDGQKIPQPFVSTGGGMPASIASAHYNKIQELYPEGKATANPGFGPGRTMRTLFGADRGHVGASLPFGGMPRNFAARGIDPLKYSMQSHGRKAFLGMPLQKLAKGWANPRYIAPSAATIAINARWRKEGFRPYNRGGMVGGLSPVRGYAAGGVVGQMVGSTAGYMGGSAIGSMLGGDMGSMIGGLGGSMLVPAMMSGIGKNADGASKSLLNFKNVLRAVVALPGPVKVAAALLAVGAAVKTVNDKINEHRQLISLGFAPTEKSAARLGIKFKSLTSQMKDFAEQTKLTKASVEQYYAATQNSGVAGLNLTIKQLSDLKASVKKDFPDYIKIFNAAKPDEVIQKATQLKAQFVAGGMSAEKATQMIYGLVASSEKANQALSVMASSGFNKIKDGATAAASSIETFSKLLKMGNTDQLASGFDQLLNSVDSFQQKLVGSKDSTGKIVSSLDAMKQTFDTLNSKSFKNQKIGQDTVNALSKQNIELGLVVNKSDTVAGAYAKIKLYLSGMDVDLRSMTSEMAQQVSLLEEQVRLDLAKTSKEGGAFGSLVDKINLYEAANKKATTSATTGIQKTQQSIDAQIKAHQKLIEKIKEEADARVKAIEKRQNAENVELSIKKKQLEYQDALAAGNMSAAAQAQMDIQGLVSSKQSDDAIQAIRDKESADTKKQQAMIDALQAKSDRATVVANNASKAADKAMAKAVELKSLLAELTAATIAAQNGITKGYESKIIDNLVTKANKLGEYDIAKQIGKDPKTGKYGLESMAQDALKKAGDGSLLVTDSKVYDAIMKGQRGGRSEGISVSKTSIPRGGTSFSTSAKSLIDQGLNLTPGTVFTDKTGKKYKITGVTDRSGSISVSPFNAGGLVKKFSQGGPRINVPRTGYQNGGSVYSNSGMSSNSSMSVGTVIMQFAETPKNGKALYAEFKEAMRVDNIKVSGGKRG